jgi:CheY-like chemotaxis protein
MSQRISLVVDDEPAVRRYIATILQQEDFQTVEAEDGVHGLEIVRELGDGVALVISDIEMSGMDGLALARNVKESHPMIPIVLVSGQANPGNGFEFVQKPFPPGTLLKAVETVMASSRR